MWSSGLYILPPLAVTKGSLMQSLRGAEAVLLLFTITVYCFRRLKEPAFAVYLTQTKAPLLLLPNFHFANLKLLKNT